MLNANPLPLNAVIPLGQNRQQQVGNVVIQQVNFIHVEHSPVGLRQQPRLKHRLPPLDRLGNIHRAQQAIFRNAERDLDEGRWDEGGGE